MLAFELDEKKLSNINILSNKIIEKVQFLKTLSPEALKSIHQMAFVSQVGASTRIENALLTDAEVNWVDTVLTAPKNAQAFEINQEAIVNKLSKDKERSVEEVAGLRALLLLAYEQIGDFFPLNETFIRGFHQQLLQYYPSASHYLGRYKMVTNSVVEKNNRTGATKIVFKTADPGPMTEVAMRDLIDWFNKMMPQHLWSFAVACEFVYRFLAIHPFQDGNGRLGRMLFLLTLLVSPDKNLAFVAKYISIDRQIERHRELYYAVLQKCSGGIFKENPHDYQMGYFFDFMLRMIDLSLDEITILYKKYLSLENLSPAQKIVLETLKDFPEKKLQTSAIEKIVKLPHRTVGHALSVLLKNSLIQKQGRGPATCYRVVF